MNAAKPLRRIWARQPRLSRAGLVWLLLCLGWGALLVRADGPNRIALVVSHDDTVITQCVEFSEDTLTGYEVLQRSGLDLMADVNSGMGAGVCRLDGVGCDFPAEDCFCRFEGSTAIFWSYWHLQGNDWQFSNQGASNHKVKPGSVEGWRWGEGTSAGDGDKPPVIPFDSICALPPTATPTPTAGATLPPPTATSTPEPTSTAAPTATPLPQPTPVIHFFTADQTMISAGEGVNLTWNLSAADAAYLRYDGGEEGVISPGSKIVYPAQTTRYTLVARKGEGQALTELVITVNPAAATSLPQPAQAAANISPIATPPAAAVLPAKPTTVESQPTAAAAAVAALPTPTAGLPLIQFAATASEVVAGECVDLTWQTTDAVNITLNEAAVDLQGSQSVCPTAATGYTLRAQGPGGESQAQVMIAVILPTAQVRVVTPAAVATVALVPTAISQVVDQPVRSAVAAEQPPSARPWLAYLGIGTVLFLFVLVPLGLVGLGGAAWWLRRR